MKKQIDRFVVVEQLREPIGGAGWRAEETLPGGIVRNVAMRQLPAIKSGDKAAEAAFAREVQAWVHAGRGPHVVGLIGAGLADGVPWLALEYAPSSLSAILGELPAAPADVARLLEQVAAGLAGLHSLEPPLLHNDIRPANIAMDRTGQFHVSGLALASSPGSEHTLAHAMAAYAAPELVSKEYGSPCPATDLYALGHMAYQMALGAKAYRHQFSSVYDERAKEAHPAKWMAWHCSIGTTPKPVHELRKDFPRPLAELMGRLMAKPLAARIATAAQVISEVRHAMLEAPAPGASVPTAAKPSPLRPGLRPAPAPAAAGAIPSPLPAPVPAPAGQYWVRLRDRKTGPFDLATLQRQARQGLISRLHQVSTDGVNWQSAASVEGLLSPAAG